MDPGNPNNAPLPDDDDDQLKSYNRDLRRFKWSLGLRI